MKFTQIPVNTFKELQLNAGILLTHFDPTSGVIDSTKILGATDGGVTTSAVPTFSDRGDGIDNATLNLKESKYIESWECKIGGTFKTVTASIVKKLLGAADISGIKITPRIDLTDADFFDVWWVGDYSSENNDAMGGFIAIHLINALSSEGFVSQSANKNKGSFTAQFVGHSSISDPDAVPFEVYVQSGTSLVITGISVDDTSGDLAIDSNIFGSSQVLCTATITGTPTPPQDIVILSSTFSGEAVNDCFNMITVNNSLITVANGKTAVGGEYRVRVASKYDVTKYVDTIWTVT